MVAGEWRKLRNEELSDLLLFTTHHHQYHQHHLANVQLGHLLTSSDLTHPEVSSVSPPVPSACRSAISYCCRKYAKGHSVCTLQSVSSAFLYFVPNRAILNFFAICTFFMSQYIWSVKINKLRWAGQVAYLGQARCIHGFD